MSDEIHEWRNRAINAVDEALHLHAERDALRAKLEEAEKEAKIWRENYYTVADAVARTSTGVKDLVRKAYETRGRATRAETEVERLRAAIRAGNNDVRCIGAIVNAKERADKAEAALAEARELLRDCRHKLAHYAQEVGDRNTDLLTEVDRFLRRLSRLKANQSGGTNAKG